MPHKALVKGNNRYCFVKKCGQPTKILNSHPKRNVFDAQGFFQRTAIIHFTSLQLCWCRVYQSIMYLSLCVYDVAHPQCMRFILFHSLYTQFQRTHSQILKTILSSCISNIVTLLLGLGDKPGFKSGETSTGSI